MLRRLFEIVRVLVFGSVLTGSLGSAGCQWSSPHPSSGKGSWEARRSFVRWNLMANNSRTEEGHCSASGGSTVAGEEVGASTPNCGGNGFVACKPHATMGCRQVTNCTVPGNSANCTVPVNAAKECSVPGNVRLAQLPKSDLKKLMGTCPSPSPASMQGNWLGVNRGIMLAVTGNATFIKRFDMLGTTNCVKGIGTNIRVCQVPLERLGYCGWQPVIKAQTGQPDMHGNFLIFERDPVELDYRKADNPLFEPTRFLVDELVQVEEGLLLGRANLQLFRWRIPVAYFALSKAE